MIPNIFSISFLIGFSSILNLAVFDYDKTSSEKLELDIEIVYLNLPSNENFVMLTADSVVNSIFLYDLK